MNLKKDRLKTILDLVQKNALNNQDELLLLLKERGFSITQATLSRDMKELKIIKSPDIQGNYIYTVSSINNSDNNTQINEPSDLVTSGFVSLAFSDKLAVIKTRPGYAMGIASDIDTRISHIILGTIAGDDTILLIPKEEVSKEEVIEALNMTLKLNVKNG